METNSTPTLPPDGNAVAPEPSNLSISAIIVDPGLSARLTTHRRSVTHLTQFLREGGTLAPLDVFDVEGLLYLADGFQRLKALQETGATDVSAYIFPGTVRDVTVHAIRVNARHGQKLSSADKRRAVLKLLDDAEWASWSDREIAELCGCSPPTVAKVRKTHPLTSKIGSDVTRYVRSKHGGRLPMRVGNLTTKRLNRDESLDGDALLAQPAGSPSPLALPVPDTSRRGECADGDLHAQSPSTVGTGKKSDVTRAEGTDPALAKQIAAPNAGDFISMLYWVEQACEMMGDPKEAAKTVAAQGPDAPPEDVLALIDWFLAFGIEYVAISSRDVCAGIQVEATSDDW